MDTKNLKMYLTTGKWTKMGDKIYATLHKDDFEKECKRLAYQMLAPYLPQSQRLQEKYPLNDGCILVKIDFNVEDRTYDISILKYQNGSNFGELVKEESYSFAKVKKAAIVYMNTLYNFRTVYNRVCVG